MFKKTIAPLAIMALLATTAPAQTTLHTIGDSTMALQDENTTDKRGWGMMFQQFFASGITVNNRAKSGASSKSFYLESAYWATVKTQIKNGDYVLIQFGHNDEKNNGLDGDTVRKYTDPAADYRGTTAQGTFKTYLRAYVNETRSLGATPILATSICRKYFSNGTITRKGRHDLGENFSVPETDHTYDYSYALAEVAAEMNVPLIDLTGLTKSLFEKYGDASCTQLLFGTGDGTHPNAMGATLVARLCAQDMYRQNILASNINTSADVLVNPISCDFGNAYTGQTLTKEMTVTGFDLSPATGTFTLSASNGFLVAANKNDAPASSVTLNYANGNLDFTRFYVSATGTTAGTASGTLTVTNGTVTKTVPLTASFIQLTGGTAVKLKWELSTTTDYTLEGPAVPIDQSFSQMYVQKYAAPNSAAIWPATSGYDATRKMQRNLITGDAWPANEIDEVSTRYIQFGISASPGTQLNIDSIGMYVCGAGGNGMRCRISYSTNRFTDCKVVQEFQSMVANTVYAASAIPVVKLEQGDTLLVRVYPWYSSAATGKTICLADVCIHGMAVNAPTAVDQTPLMRTSCSVNGQQLTINNAPTGSTVRVCNILGETVYETVQLGCSPLTVDLKAPGGIYLCSVRKGPLAECHKVLAGSSVRYH